MNRIVKLDRQVSDPLMRTRIDLAALHRIAWRWGWSEAVVNHMTALVPGANERFLLLPYGVHWSEARASDFLIVGLDGTIVAGNGTAEISALALHGPLHRRLPQARCVLHTHQPNISWLSSLQDQTLLMAHQDAIVFHGVVAYLDAYDEVPIDAQSGEACAKILGADKYVLLMKNHGPVVVGETIAKTFQMLYYLDRVAGVQMRAMQTGRPLQLISDNFAGANAEFFRDHYLTAEADMHFAAIKRLLDREEPDYAD